MLKSASQRLYHIHWSLATKLCSEKSLLLTCQILGPLVNTFAADEKYPVLKSVLNLEHFEKKDDLHSFCVSDITDSGNVVI